jgi:NAD(P)-dependent dehydrogenase (short-subunit alcohol dehydrogenase family)
MLRSAACGNEAALTMILTGKCAIVTGAGSGIGRGSAEILARHGASVLVSDRDGAAAMATAEAIRTAGGKAHAMTTDVSDDA